MLPAFVVYDLRLFDRYEGAARRFLDHLIGCFKKLLDPAVDIYYLYDDRKVERQIQQFRSMNSAARAIRKNSAQNCRTGYALFFCRVNKRFVQRLMPVLV